MGRVSVMSAGCTCAAAKHRHANVRPGLEARLSGVLCCCDCMRKTSACVRAHARLTCEALDCEALCIHRSARNTTLSRSEALRRSSICVMTAQP
jgi:hypothetical protein